MKANTKSGRTTASPANDTQGFHFNWGIAHAHVPNRDHRQPTPAPEPAPGLGGGAGGSGLLPPLQQK